MCISTHAPVRLYNSILMVTMVKSIKQVPNTDAFHAGISTLSLITAKGLLWTLFTTSALLYALFQKKLLPKPVAKVVSKVLFYPTFPITALLRINNYWSQVDDTLILGCAPMSLLNHPSKLHKLGIRGVVNMCAEYGGPVSDYSSLGIKQLWLPTVDHFEPTLENMKDAVQFIKDCKSKGEKVYVHCKAGHGRAASIALCWMMHENKSVSSQELNALLRAKRKVRSTLYLQQNVKSFESFLDR